MLFGLQKLGLNNGLFTGFLNCENVYRLKNCEISRKLYLCLYQRVETNIFYPKNSLE